MKFYKIFEARVPVRLSNGAVAYFQDAGNKIGVLATDDPHVTSGLDECVSKKLGGVSEISQTQYDDLLKSKTSYILRKRPTRSGCAMCGPK